MEKLPETLSPKNKQNFAEEYTEYITRKLREEIYLHVISSEEKQYFVLDNFFKKYKKSDNKLIIEKLILELEANGWNCKTSFGGTGLFIYSTEKPPSNCYEDGF